MIFELYENQMQGSKLMLFGFFLKFWGMIWPQSYELLRSLKLLSFYLCSQVLVISINKNSSDLAEVKSFFLVQGN